MLLPTMKNIRSSGTILQDFKGYNHNPVIAENQFYDMKNISSDLYPVLSCRKPRGTVGQLTKPNGLTDKNGLAWVDGTSFYYNGEVKGTVSDTEKKFALMGAYILIFPDKKYFNTNDGAFGSLESVFSGTATITGSDVEGNPANITSSVYIKIAATGIGNYFKKLDGVTISGATITAVNKTAVIQYLSADFIVILGTLTTTGSTAITVKRAVPDMDFFTEAENRIWGCSSANHEIYACKIGDPFNWNCYEGISTDSYAVTVGTDGDFTGAATYIGYVLFFKEDCIHKVYGSKPSNYQIYTTPCRGVAKGAEKSVVQVNETLYYMSRNGICAYAGAMPESISSELGAEIYSEAVAGAYKDKYVVSMKNTAGIWNLFSYNEKSGIWNNEDSTHVLYFTNYEGILYYIDAGSNKLMTIEGTDQEVIEWYAEFGDTVDTTLQKRYVAKLQLRVELEANSKFDVSIQYDSNDIWDLVTAIKGDRNRLYSIPIITRRCDHYRLKITGTGLFKLYGITRFITGGSDL